MKIEPFPGQLTKQALRYVLSPEQEAWLIRWFPKLENQRLAEASGMSHTTLHRFARELGLKKSERGMRGIKHRQALQVKRACTRSGFYASLRGKKPSEATRRATAQMWQDIRDGKREHPFHVMKRKNPRKYQKYMQRKSEERKETIRKEKLRMVYGLKRKTRLKCVVLCKYTKRQVDHRYNALRRGYIIMEDCSEQGGERYNIYYDDETKRSALFERNLLKDGFKLVKYEQV